MKTTKLIAYGFVFLMAAAFLVTIAPSGAAQATAQKASITLAKQTADTGGTLKSGRLPPEIAAYQHNFDFTVEIPPATGVCPASTVTVNFVVTKKPEYAVATMSPASITKAISQQAGAQPTPVTGLLTTLTVVTTRKAPAFGTGEYIITATAVPSAQATSGCNINPSDAFPVNLQIVNDYLPIMEYAPAKYIQKTGQNKDVIFTVKMTNFGNGDTKVNALVSPVSKNKLDAIIPPSQTTLESKAISGEKALFSKDATISGRTPHSNGYTNSIYTFSVAFTAASVQTGTDIAKDEQTLTLSVQVQGVYVPGFDPTMAIAALGVGLVLLGARRRLQ